MGSITQPLPSSHLIFRAASESDGETLASVPTDITPLAEHVFRAVTPIFEEELQFKAVVRLISGEESAS